MSDNRDMKLNRIRTIASIITVAAVAGVVALAIPANGAGTTDNRYITVTGVGTVSVVPDAVRFNATVSSLASTNAAALSSASKSASAVRAALKEKGIEKIAQKVGEEAIETVIEALRSNDALFLNESADLLFHYLILLQAKGFTLDDVLKVLHGRKK